MAEEVGFEPTCLLPDNPISSRARYVHFGTPPRDKPIITNNPDRLSQVDLHYRDLILRGPDRPPSEGLPQHDRLHQKGGVRMPPDPVLHLASLAFRWRIPAVPGAIFAARQSWYSGFSITFNDRFRGLCNVLLEPCQVRKEAALRGSARVPQIPRSLTPKKEATEP